MSTHWWPAPPPVLTWRLSCRGCRSRQTRRQASLRCWTRGTRARHTRRRMSWERVSRRRWRRCVLSTVLRPLRATGDTTGTLERCGESRRTRSILSKSTFDFTSCRLSSSRWRHTAGQRSSYKVRRRSAHPKHGHQRTTRLLPSIRVSTSCSTPSSRLPAPATSERRRWELGVDLAWLVQWNPYRQSHSWIDRPLDLDVLLVGSHLPSLHLATSTERYRTMPSPRSLSLGLTLVLCSFANIVQAVPPPSGVAPSPTQTYVSPPPSEATKTPETGSGQGQAVPLRKKNGVPLTNDDGTANLDSLHRQVGLVVALV